MADKVIFSFPGKTTATIVQVGGKGLSLMQGSQAALPVPPGFILSVAFFDPWFKELKKTKAWHAFLKPEEFDLEKSCAALKKEALKFSYTAKQEADLSEALRAYPNETLFAVRSSSPEEDLEGSSFAGGYETVLGVGVKKIPDAIKKAFASCLDYRVTVYKKENGFDTADPKIAVIIQEQIASDVAGVGFSLNPVTNNFDEAVINANFGLGETVVQGIATPDTYTVNKLLLHIEKKQLGTKETAIYLMPDGGTQEKKDLRHAQFTLSDDQVIQLTKLIKKVEELYGKPMDIEWAYAKDTLYLLQARPITAYVPLSPDTKTEPGQKKRLYFDVTTTAQGMDQPVSVIGASSFRRLVRIVGRIVFRKDITTNIDTSIAWVAGNGRLYANLSIFLKIFGKKGVLKAVPIIDPLAAKALQELDEREYLSPVNKFSMLPIGLLLKLPRILLFVSEAKRHPQKIHEQTQKELSKFEQDALLLAAKDMPLATLWDTLLHAMFYRVFLRTVPLTFASRSTLSEMKHMAGDNLQKEADRLELALPNNVTTEMGLSLSHVASLLPEKITYEQLRKRIEKHELPSDFMTAWEAFLERYGLRGPSEIDIAAPRYRENPSFLLDLMVTMRHADPEDNPQTKFTKNEKERQKAYETMYQYLLSHNEKKAHQFASSYHFFETFGGYRETHKYYLIFVVDLMRKKVLDLAHLLQKEGRLETIEQVFYLTIEDLDRATTDKTYNLLEVVTKNQADRRQYEHVHYPSIIDSRGFIPHPAPNKDGKGEISGMPISQGVVHGKIKVLHSPSEKPLKKGEILVARATDPGWTPLFTNAGGVILEIGGVLQHGALVAREYGLPCVAGVENATTRFQDGMLVEVDGSAGTIRILDEKAEKSK